MIFGLTPLMILGVAIVATLVLLLALLIQRRAARS
jgi:hypothetical protein